MHKGSEELEIYIYKHPWSAQLPPSPEFQDIFLINLPEGFRNCTATVNFGVNGATRGGFWALGGSEKFLIILESGPPDSRS